MTSGNALDLVVLNATLEQVTFVLPHHVPTVPRVGEALSFLLDAKGGLLAAPVRATLAAVVADRGRLCLVCTFRKADIVAAQRTAETQASRNRRATFRVSPKDGEELPVAIMIADVTFDGWVVDLSASGVRIATSSPAIEELRPDQESRIHLAIPGFEHPADSDCLIVRTVRNGTTRFCGFRFNPSAPHSEFERKVVGYVMRRQREIIQRLRASRMIADASGDAQR